MLQGKPVTDVCDTDVMDKCLQTKGLDTYGIGKVRRCLLHAGASDIAAADEARLEAESQVIQIFSSRPSPLTWIGLPHENNCRCQVP